MTICGIYSIDNAISKKSYIGSSVHIIGRWGYHKRLIRKNQHDNKHLQNAWNKYGSDCFSFKVLEELPKENLLYVEQQYLDFCRLIPHWFYNMAYDASAPMRGKVPWNKGKKGVQTGSNIGRKFSDSWKFNLSKSRVNLELAKGNNNGMFGKKHSAATREKMKLAWKNRKPISDKTRMKMSIAQKKRFGVI